jgi:hypothetical protein
MTKKGAKMSNAVNDNLIERAHELAEEITSHPSGYDKTLLQALERGDLEDVRRLVVFIEGELSRAHFMNYNIV